jgi:hypothetical protein
MLGQGIENGLRYPVLPTTHMEVTGSRRVPPRGETRPVPCRLQSGRRGRLDLRPHIEIQPAAGRTFSLNRATLQVPPWRVFSFPRAGSGSQSNPAKRDIAPRIQNVPMQCGDLHRTILQQQQTDTAIHRSVLGRLRAPRAPTSCTDSPAKPTRAQKDKLRFVLLRAGEELGARGAIAPPRTDWKAELVRYNSNGQHASHHRGRIEPRMLG